MANGDFALLFLSFCFFYLFALFVKNVVKLHLLRFCQESKVL